MNIHSDYFYSSILHFKVNKIIITFFRFEETDIAHRKKFAVVSIKLSDDSFACLNAD